MLDLATVRETLVMLRQDLATEPRHDRVCAAIDEAIAGIDAQEPPAKTAASGELAATFGSRFVRWTPER